ncbi:hypothetical protein BDW60DRAFT_218983 [Aspergillus nidulans var. acristatus]
MGDDASLQSFRQRTLCVIIWRAAAARPKRRQMIQQRCDHHLCSFLRHSCNAALEGKRQVGPSPAAFWPCQAASCHPGLGRHCSWNRKIFVDVTLCGIQSTSRLGRPSPLYGMADSPGMSKNSNPSSTAQSDSIGSDGHSRSEDGGQIRTPWRSAQSAHEAKRAEREHCDSTANNRSNAASQSLTRDG